jgi:hypothetical protein
MTHKRDWLPGPRADQILMVKDWLSIFEPSDAALGDSVSQWSLRSRDFRDKNAAPSGQILF